MNWLEKINVGEEHAGRRRYIDCAHCYRQAIDVMRSLIDRYREALEFYAAGNHYVDYSGDGYDIGINDDGEKARQALEGK